MAVIEIVPARASHLRRLAQVMRQADRDEVMARSGSTPIGALMSSYRGSTVCMVALVDGLPEVIWGAGDINILTGTGSPWMLGSEAINAHRKDFLRHSSHWRDQLLQRYSVLKNVVDCRNTVAIRWLRWLGFRFSDPFDYRGHDFMLFELEAPPCAN